MGQYHAIYNRTRKESFSIGGAKLWGQAQGATAAALLLLLSNSNGRGGGDLMIYPDKYTKEGKPVFKKEDKARNALVEELSGRWAGDEIVVQGDYAEPQDEAFITDEEFKNYKNITDKVLKALIALDPESETDVGRVAKEELEWQAKLKQMRGSK